MKSRSGDTSLADIYTPWSICGPNIVSPGCMVMAKLTSSESWHKFKSVDRENEVKDKWHMPSWHLHFMINMWTKYSEPRLYGNSETGLITQIWHKFNKVGRPWKWGQGQVTHAWLICTHHDQCVDQVWRT